MPLFSHKLALSNMHSRQFLVNVRKNYHSKRTWFAAIIDERQKERRRYKTPRMKKIGFCCWHSMHAYCLFHALISIGLAHCVCLFHFFFFATKLLTLDKRAEPSRKCSFCEKCVQYFDNQIVIIPNVIVLLPNMLFVQEIRRHKMSHAKCIQFGWLFECEATENEHL